MSTHPWALFLKSDFTSFRHLEAVGHVKELRTVVEVAGPPGCLKCQLWLSFEERYCGIEVEKTAKEELVQCGTWWKTIFFLTSNNKLAVTVQSMGVMAIKYSQLVYISVSWSWDRNIFQGNVHFIWGLLCILGSQRDLPHWLRRAIVSELEIW